ncbi:fructoselysine 6-kinase [Phycicoccus badiiscoriae]|uniref:Fructoselysine 6-kinase n=1 Tax=Pedococcus badiiscoriae TaxID=642776 RepID=A0A852WQ14_9MICO|nr:PfkB family carbohydrate kinase [Pedococcus badiiscoriae]NYG07332.1 fructoselysine 6-kinase [Pedococcus badiiscoriae]
MNVTLLTLGDNVVDRYLERGVLYPGGNAVNVAVHGRRCGAGAAYIGAVGTDLAGRTVLDALVAEGVDTSMLRVVEGPNASADVRVVDGNRVFDHGDPGVSRFVLTPADFAAVAAATVVHTGECSMVEDQLGDISAAAPRLSFDFSERPRAYIAEYAPLVDIAIRSLPFASVDEAVHEARRIQDLGPGLVAVTMGAGGAVALQGEHVVYAQAPATPVVDTLGAGDAFIGRLLAGLIGDMPLATLLGAATAYASSTCATFGAFGYETSLEGLTAPLNPIHKGVDLT